MLARELDNKPRHTRGWNHQAMIGMLFRKCHRKFDIVVRSVVTAIIQLALLDRVICKYRLPPSPNLPERQAR